MLGAAETPFESAAEDVSARSRGAMGAERHVRRTTVAVDFDLCVRCGGCMVGCRYGAKNTLDRNYLRLAEEGGARVHAEREATLLRRVDGGWEVETRRPARGCGGEPSVSVREQVVLAAGVLGTLRLLLRSGVGGPNVGSLVRSNSEVIVGAGARSTAVDYSEGIAIGSSFHPNADTRIEPVRYPKGSSLMGLFSTVLVDGGGRVPRPLRWLARSAAPSAPCARRRTSVALGGADGDPARDAGARQRAARPLDRGGACARGAAARAGADVDPRGERGGAPRGRR